MTRPSLGSSSSVIVGLGLALGGCGSPPRAIPVAARLPPAAPSVEGARYPPSATSDTPRSPTPPEPAAGVACIVHGDLSLGGVTWPLRSRADAIATLVVEEGTVTAWLEPEARGKRPIALAQIENASMKVRAFVWLEDMRVHLTQAIQPLPGYLPDGRTRRQVLGVGVEADEAVVSLEFAGASSTTENVPCGALGLMPTDIDYEAVLPAAQGDVVVKQSALIMNGDSFVRAEHLSIMNPSAVSPKGALGKRRGLDAGGKHPLVSFQTCGGTIFGTVEKTDLLGVPRVEGGGSLRCPNTNAGVYLKERPLVRPMSCLHGIPLFIKTETLEDPVGVLKASARFELEAPEAPTMTRIRVDAPAATPLRFAGFTVRTSDLTTCTAP